MPTSGPGRGRRHRTERTSLEASSAGEAVALTESGRLELSVLVMLLWTIGGAGIVALLGGPVEAQRVAWVGLALLGGGHVWLARVLRTTRDFERDRRVTLVSMVNCLGAVVLASAFGSYSAFIGIVSIASTVFSLSTPPRSSVGAYATLAFGYGTLQAMVWSGHSLDYDLLGAPPTSNAALGTICVGTQLGLLTSFGVGRVARKQYQRVVERFEGAVRRAAARDALLREAREELARAAGIGKDGRFSDQEIGGYRLGVVLGRGGMGEVYEAVRIGDGAPCAIKLLRASGLGDADAVARFEREARIAARLRSPHIVEVYEIGGADAVLPFIAMERLHGADLAACLREKGLLSLSECVELTSDVAVALEVAHAAGVIHRDLKPHNLFLVRDETRARWKVLDFGVSKLIGSGVETLTSGALVGTPSYMPPEQAMGGPIDARADVYALTAVLYRSLTGEPPFRGSDPAKVVRRVVDEMPVDPRAIRPVPDAVAHVLRIGLAKSPDDRFRSARELALALRDAASGTLSAEWSAHAGALLAVQPWGAADQGDAASSATLAF